MECVRRARLPRPPRVERLEVARHCRRLCHDLLQETGSLPRLQVGIPEPSTTTSGDPPSYPLDFVEAVCAPVLHEKTADPETSPLTYACPASASLSQSPRPDSVTGTLS